MGLSDELDALESAAKEKAEAQKAADAEDERKARQLLRDFVDATRQRSIPPEKIRTTSMSGTHRTSFLGWDLGQRFCVGTDGELYSTAVTAGWFTDKSPTLMTPRTEFPASHDFTTYLKSLLLDFLQKHKVD